tara:strand:- start:216 stop:2639 length:2424 start_codon:yes stop_codon:yes gene_type:complete
MIRWFNEISLRDIDLVGGKNASLGEMFQNMHELSIKVPNGFAITTKSFDIFIEHNNLNKFINSNLEKLRQNFNLANLGRIGIKIRNKILDGNFPKNLENEILKTYKQLSNNYFDTDGNPQNNTDVAVRSSGTAEDLPDASFAGQQETYLNVRNNNELLLSIKNCFASLYTDRAISYRNNRKIDCEIKISVGIQKMVRSDLGSAGVAFSIDTESGYDKIILINGAFGLGELVVSGQIKPDEILVYKPLLNGINKPIIDKKLGEKTCKIVYGKNPGQKIEKIKLSNEYKNKFCISKENILKLSQWIIDLEKYYTNLHGKWCPLDIEWAIDGLSNELYLVQARPETVISKKNNNILKQYKLLNKDKSHILLEGVAVGNKIGRGEVKKMSTLDSRDEINTNFKKGDILVTEMTDPDWEPIMKLSSGIITNKGGRTCHASVVARELGIPAIVGTLNCTELLNNGQEITMSCAEGDIGKVYDGIIDVEESEIYINKLPKIKTKLMLNLASPSKAFNFHNYPVKGVGLVRQEFIFNNYIKVHPMALLNHKKIGDKELTDKINLLSQGFKSEKNFFIKKLSYGISRIAATFYPNPVIVRFSDFKSNEYFNLLGGKYYEPKEENPMIGWRGASRYYSDNFKEAFGLECEAIKNVRDNIGLDNVVVMIPFCRTVGECKKVLKTMEEYGLKRGDNGLKVFLMCEIPSNVIMADEFTKYVDGYSIGSNDLTQLTLGLDRDSELVQDIYNERDESVKFMMKTAIEKCKKNNTKIGICGQGPSDYPEIASYLVKAGIDTISITPDSLVKTIETIHKVENEN